MTYDIVDFADLPDYLEANGLRVVDRVNNGPVKVDGRGAAYGPGDGWIPHPSGKRHKDGTPVLVFAIVVQKI